MKRRVIVRGAKSRNLFITFEKDPIAPLNFGRYLYKRYGMDETLVHSGNLHLSFQCPNNGPQESSSKSFHYTCFFLGWPKNPTCNLQYFCTYFS